MNTQPPQRLELMTGYVVKRILSLNSASIASMLGSADCSDAGSARVSSKVDTPNGLSSPRTAYSASAWLLRWQRSRPMVGASSGCCSWAGRRPSS
jgi:hypothetical protein